MAVLLPGERSFRRDLRSVLTHAEKLVLLAVRVFGDGRNFTFTRCDGIDERVFRLGLTLLSKGCKLHRGVILLAGRGLSQEAEVLHRSLFETYLACEFVLRRRIPLADRQGNRKPHVPKITYEQMKGQPFTSKIRAKLYDAYFVFEVARLGQVVAETPGIRDIARRRRTAEIDVGLAEAKNLVGPGWWRVLTKTKSYHGMGSTKKLARVLGRLDFRDYGLSYKPQSWSVHAVDAQFHSQYDGDALRLFTVDKRELAKTVAGATIRLEKMVDRVNKRFGVGLDHEIKAFCQRFTQELGSIR